MSTKVTTEKIRRLYVAWSVWDVDRRAKEFDAWLAAHDRALREQIEQQMIERAYSNIAWEKGLTISPTGPDRAKVPPHWVKAATARVAPYLDLIRGEGSE